MPGATAQELEILLTNTESTNCVYFWQKRIKEFLEKNAVIVKTLSFGLNSFILSTHIAANGKFLVLLDEEGASAAAISTSYYSVIIGSFVGVLLSTGFKLAPAIGKADFIEAGNYVKTAWILTSALGIVLTGVMLATKPVLPLIFSEKSGEIAGNFFLGYAPVGIPLLLLGTNSQFAFLAGEWLLPPLASGIFTSVGIGLSYALGIKCGLGALGIGLGGTLSGILVSIGLQLWFLRTPYQKYNLYTLKLPPRLKERLLELLKLGWKLSLQRLTEWGNWMLITTGVGISPGRVLLKAIEPSIQYIRLLASTFQGVAQGTGMVISKHKGVLSAARGNKQVAKKAYDEMRKALFIGNAGLVVIGGILAGSFYFAREPLIAYFLPGSDQHSQHLAEQLLWINMIGLIPDAVRIVSAGALRSWDDVLFSTIISFVAMSVLGIPIGFAVSLVFHDEFQSLFVTRDITLLLSAILIFIRARSFLNKSLQDIDAMDEAADAELDVEEESLQEHEMEGMALLLAQNGIFSNTAEERSESPERTTSNTQESNVDTHTQRQSFGNG